MQINQIKGETLNFTFHHPRPPRPPTPTPQIQIRPWGGGGGGGMVVAGFSSQAFSLDNSQSSNSNLRPIPTTSR